MISLPNDPCVVEELERLADWAEVSCLLSEAGEIWKDELADDLHDSGLLEPPAAKDDGSLQEQSELLASDILSTLVGRQSRLGTSYPFTVEMDRIAAPNSWRDHICYIALLLDDLGHFHTNFERGPSTRFTLYFEKIVQACVAAITKGDCIRFGWPRDRGLGWATHPAERVVQLAERLGVLANGVTERVDAHEKDIGLDVVARWEFGDARPGSLFLLVQCATGKNWRNAKKGEPSLARWRDLLWWRSRLQRVIAFPWRADMSDKNLAIIASNLEAIILDRMRLLSAGNPDPHLDARIRPGIEEWCDKRMAELRT